MLEGTAFEVFDMVSSGRAEVGIFATLSNAANIYRMAIESHDLIYKKITDRKLYVMLGSRNPLYTKQGSDIHLEELSDYAFAYYTEAIQEAPIMDLFAGGGMIKRQVSLPFEPVNPTISMPGEQGLRFFNLADEDVYIELGWVRRAGHELSPLAQEFMDCMYSRVERLLNLIV